MKKTAIAILVMLIASLVVAQEVATDPSKKSRPNFGGSWIRDFSVDSKGKSTKAIIDIMLVVDHQEPEIKFLEDAGVMKDQELTYYTDERGEENPSGISIHTGQGSDSGQFAETLKSKTKWDGEKVVTRGLIQRVINGHTFRIEVVKEWKLSKDGNALTVILRRTNRNSSSIQFRGPGITRSDMTSETKSVYRRST